METELIIINKIYQSSRIEAQFIRLLKDEGLIEIVDIDGEQYIRESNLSDLERFARWYYDLSINIEGIDVINNLLEKLNLMNHELRSLRRRIDSTHSNFDDIEL